MNLMERIEYTMNQHLEEGENPYTEQNIATYIGIRRNTDIFGYEYYAAIRLRGWRNRVCLSVVG